MVRKITRTIRTMEVEYLGVDVDTHETFNGKETIPYQSKPEKIIDVLKSAVEPENKSVKVVSVNSYETKTDKYEMLESDFIAHANRKEN